MKGFILAVCLIFVCSYAQAQCVAEVKDVFLDQERGSIVIETQYKLNTIIVDPRGEPCVNCTGKTRYNEETGTIQQIVVKAKADIDQHCGNLIIRNAVKVNNLNESKLNIQKDLTRPLIDTLKKNAVGWTKSVSETIVQFKNKEITVNADGTYSITNSTP